MIQATDSRVLDTLANDPDILPYVSPGGEPLDFSACFTPEWNNRNRFYHNADETIGIYFQWTAPMNGGGTWAVHMMALPVARGGDALAFAREAMNDMLVNQGADGLWGETPVWNERARKMHAKVGISRGFGISPLFGEVELFSVTRDEWEAL